MATIWLSPDDVADRLGIHRRTAMAMMYQMPHSVIGGTVRQRIRVSEQTFEAWMLKHSSGKPILATVSTGSNRKLGRR